MTPQSVLLALIFIALLSVACAELQKASISSVVDVSPDGSTTSTNQDGSGASADGHLQTEAEQRELDRGLSSSMPAPTMRPKALASASMPAAQPTAPSVSSTTNVFSGAISTDRANATATPAAVFTPAYLLYRDSPLCLPTLSSFTVSNRYYIQHWHWH